MQKKLVLLTAGLIMSTLLGGCGKDSELTQFKKDIDTFCTDISTLDTAMNNVDATAVTAKAELLGYLDFPEEFDYLEALADESSEYMTEAVTYYHKTYDEAATFNEANANYAQENYSRALKRVQIIITFLHGEEPADMDIEIQYE